MAKKNILIAITAVVLVIVVVAITASFSNNDPKEEEVTYNGNGGLTIGGESVAVFSNETVQPCMFIYNNYAFDSWNTKADGSGTTYTEGESVDYGTVLYAQWTETYAVTDCSIDIGPLTLNFNGEIVDTSSPIVVFPAVLPTSIITLTGISDWEYSGDIFSCVYEGNTYTLTITVIDADNVTCTLVDDIPTITIETTSNIELSLMFVISE